VQGDGEVPLQLLGAVAEASTEPGLRECKTHVCSVTLPKPHRRDQRETVLWAGPPTVPEPLQSGHAGAVAALPFSFLSLLSQKHLPRAAVSGSVPTASAPRVKRSPEGPCCAGRVFVARRGVCWHRAWGISPWLLKTLSFRCSFGRPLLAWKPLCRSFSLRQTLCSALPAFCLALKRGGRSRSSQRTCSAEPLWFLIWQRGCSCVPAIVRCPAEELPTGAAAASPSSTGTPASSGLTNVSAAETGTHESLQSHSPGMWPRRSAWLCLAAPHCHR